jgi:hypothetical protein
MEDVARDIALTGCLGVDDSANIDNIFKQEALNMPLTYTECFCESRQAEEAIWACIERRFPEAYAEAIKPKFTIRP